MKNVGNLACTRCDIFPIFMPKPSSTWKFLFTLKLLTKCQASNSLVGFLLTGKLPSHGITFW